VTASSSPNAVAFIPARHGSKRVPGKNTRPLAGHPLLAYTVAPALESGVFSSVIVSTDSEETAVIARHYGAEVPFLRPAAFSGDTSPDIEWLEHALTELQRQGRAWDAFSLLRPTSPFRTAAVAPGPRLEGRTIAGEVLAPFLTKGYEGFDINDPTA